MNIRPLFIKTKKNYSLFIIVLFVCSSGLIFTQSEVMAGSSEIDSKKRPVLSDNILNLPLISIDNLKYIGGFRIKNETYGDSRAGYSVGKMAYNPDAHSIFLAGHAKHKAIAEFKIPKLVNSKKIKNLKITGKPIQNFSKVLNRTDTKNRQKLNRLGGMEYINGELLVHAYEYYDAKANNSDTTLVIRDAGDLKNSNIDGFFKFSGKAHEILWISPIPDKLQAIFKGDYISGASSAMPINGRSSMGPSAFILKSQDIINNKNTKTSIKTIRVLDFSLKHIMAQTKYGSLPFSKWKGFKQYNYSGKRPAGKAFGRVYDKKLVGNNNLWTEASSAVYGLIIPGTRTYAVFGSSAMHNSGGGYKITQKNGRLCGGPCQYDPKDQYNYYWFFDIKDLLDVKKGKRRSYEVKPYDYGLFKTPFKSLIQGGTFNKVDGIIYFSLPKADRVQNIYEKSPVILAYKLELTQ